MENFNFYVPTDIRFGKDRLDELRCVRSIWQKCLTCLWWR